MEPQDYKKDQGKVRMDLLPPLALKRIANVFTFGADKYSSWSYANGVKYSRLYAAMQRHLNAWHSGDSLDIEPNCEGCKNGNCTDHTGTSHLHNAGACLMMLIEMEALRPDMDDRPTHYFDLPPSNKRHEQVREGIIESKSNISSATNNPAMERCTGPRGFIHVENFDLLHIGKEYYVKLSYDTPLTPGNLNLFVPHDGVDIDYLKRVITGTIQEAEYPAVFMKTENPMYVETLKRGSQL